jgi:nucleoside-diphosphate-sugar epimerase
MTHAMKLLVIGGAGYVGRLVLPLLAERFTLRVFDRNPPEDFVGEFIAGDVTDPQALLRAAEGMEALLYMAMGKGGPNNIQDPTPAYDVNVKGVHLALDAARNAGIRHTVYTSSLSVHDGHDLTSGEFDSEEAPAEPLSVYGLTKWMGEEACRFFHRKHGLPILALRLFRPVSVEQWESGTNYDRLDCRTAAPDLARALISALELEHDSFEIIHVTGDATGRAYRHEKAKRILGWEPQFRR